MSIWRRAEELLKAIQGDLKQDPPNWKDAVHTSKNLKLLVPAFPMFEGFEEGQSLKVHDWRLTELRSDLDHLQIWLTKQDQDSAVVSVLSALRNVQVLGRKKS